MKEAWIISVDMGYGHQRAAYSFKDIAYRRIITANTDRIVSKDERKKWTRLQYFYEFASRARSVPLIGRYLWRIVENFQAISPYYPFRDLSKPNFGSIYQHKLIKKNFLSALVEYTNKRKIPFVSTFFMPAIAAAHARRKDVYCIVTDTDINRAWVPEEPKKELLYYLTPTKHSTQRIIAYGVPKENIFFTGFPLPKENVGENLEIAKNDLGNRISNLDAKKTFLSRHSEVKANLKKCYRKLCDHPVTLTFAVGGAGAQKEIGATALISLKKKIKEHKIKINLVAGVRNEVKAYFEDVIKEAGLKNEMGKFVNILHNPYFQGYFKDFNALLRKTDILWTKPSELSFYTALGLPIIIAPALGIHENLNKEWLIKMGAGLKQENPEFTDGWLFEWLDDGRLAEAAWEGFKEAPRFGTYNIEKLIFSKDKKKVKFRY